jgi:hypothetical protein
MCVCRPNRPGNIDGDDDIIMIHLMSTLEFVFFSPEFELYEDLIQLQV